MVVLHVLDGQGRRSVTVDGDLVTIGRDPHCELYLPGDPTISRRHAVLTRHGDGWAVADAGSRNGVLVNGRAITREQTLSPGDRIMVGEYVVVLPDELDEVAETEPADGPGTGGHLRARTGLSPREIEVLRLVCAGHTDQQIADSMFLSIKTVHSHLERIRAKTDCRRRAELVRWAISQGLA